ncbi:hypothetical protein, partial [Vibrio crassostreae]|uniref:hypothetical protein n=1 Tax=Vibrio crassostreae TaxID=246167 RepID=UPI001C93ABA8
FRLTHVVTTLTIIKDQIAGLEKGSTDLGNNAHPDYSHLSSAFKALRIPFTRIPYPLLSSSYPAYSNLASAFQALRISFTRIPYLYFKLLASRICFSSSSHPDYSHLVSAFQALRIPFTRIPHLLFKHKKTETEASVFNFTMNSEG